VLGKKNKKLGRGTTLGAGTFFKIRGKKRKGAVAEEKRGSGRSATGKKLCEGGWRQSSCESSKHLRPISIENQREDRKGIS